MHSIHPIGLDPIGPDDIIRSGSYRVKDSLFMKEIQYFRCFWFYILVLGGDFDVLKHTCLVSQGSFKEECVAPDRCAGDECICYNIQIHLPCHMLVCV